MRAEARMPGCPTLDDAVGWPFDYFVTRTTEQLLASLRVVCEV